METTELMVGDWVLLMPPLGRIEPAEPFRIAEPMDLELAFRCKPIRLTGEILRRFGFIEQHRRLRMHYRVNGCQFVIEYLPPQMSVAVNGEQAGNFEILHVHELQHLLKLLKIQEQPDLKEIFQP